MERSSFTEAKLLADYRTELERNKCTSLQCKSTDEFLYHIVTPGFVDNRIPPPTRKDHGSG